MVGDGSGRILKLDSFYFDFIDSSHSKIKIIFLFLLHLFLLIQTPIVDEPADRLNVTRLVIDERLEVQNI